MASSDTSPKVTPSSPNGSLTTSRRLLLRKTISQCSSNALPPIALDERYSILISNALAQLDTQLERGEGEESPTASEREYVVDQRNRILQVGLQRTDHLRYNSHCCYNGLFIDYCVRMRSDKRSGNRIKNLLDPSPGAYAFDGDDLVKTEKLYSIIRRAIVYYYKEQADPAFRSFRSFYSHAQEILLHKKDTRALNEAVNKYRLEMQMITDKKPESKEPPEARRQRLDEFWPSYQNSHRTIDVRIASTGAGHLPLGTGVGGKVWPRAYADEKLDTCSPPSDAWKMRSFRGKQPYPGGRGRQEEEEDAAHEHDEGPPRPTTGQSEKEIELVDEQSSTAEEVEDTKAIERRQHAATIASKTFSKKTARPGEELEKSFIVQKHTNDDGFTTTASHSEKGETGLGGRESCTGQIQSDGASWHDAEKKPNDGEQQQK